MGADNMASQERGMNPPIIPRIGEGFGKIVKNLANRVGRRGIMQASTQAPPKPETKTDETDQSKKEARELIEKTSSQQPPGKPPGITRREFLKRAGYAVGGIGLTTATGFGVKGLIESISGPRPAEKSHETVAPFNNNLLDKQVQTLVPGVNAHEITSEEEETFIKSASFPELVPAANIKTVEDSGEIAVLTPIDLQRAGKVEVKRNSIIRQGGPLKGQEIPSNITYFIENQDVPVGLFIPEGINTDNVEIFLKTPNRITGQVSFATFYEKFDLGNNHYLIMDIYTGTDMGNANAQATDIIKNAPTIDPNRPKGDYIKDILQGTGLKLNVREKSALFKTLSPNSRINIFILHSDANDLSNSGVPIPTLAARKGNLLFSTPR